MGEGPGRLGDARPLGDGLLLRLLGDGLIRRLGDGERRRRGLRLRGDRDLRLGEGLLRRRGDLDLLLGGDRRGDLDRGLFLSLLLELTTFSSFTTDSFGSLFSSGGFSSSTTGFSFSSASPSTLSPFTISLLCSSLGGSSLGGVGEWLLDFDLDGLSLGDLLGLRPQRPEPRPRLAWGDLERLLFFSFLSLSFRSFAKTSVISSSFFLRLACMRSCSACRCLISSFFCSRNLAGMPPMLSMALTSSSHSSAMKVRAFLALRKPVRLICISLPSGHCFSSS